MLAKSIIQRFTAYATETKELTRAIEENTEFTKTFVEVIEKHSGHMDSLRDEVDALATRMAKLNKAFEDAAATGSAIDAGAGHMQEGAQNVLGKAYKHADKMSLAANLGTLTATHEGLVREIFEIWDDSIDIMSIGFGGVDQRKRVRIVEALAEVAGLKMTDGSINV